MVIDRYAKFVSLAAAVACLCGAPVLAEDAESEPLKPPEATLASNHHGGAHASAITGHTSGAIGGSSARTNAVSAVTGNPLEQFNPAQLANPAQLGPVVTPLASPDPNFVQPGPLETMRKQLLEQIKMAETRGVGVQTYRNEFRKLNQLVAGGAGDEDIKKRLMSIVTSLHSQIRMSNRARQIRRAVLSQPKALSKETILAPAQEIPW